MGIAALSDWLKELLPGNQPQTPTWLPKPQPAHQQQSTIQPGVPLPTFTPHGDSYDVQGLAPGASTFADRVGLGVLRNPPTGVVYFDPTGQANDSNHGYKGNYLAVPMAQPQFQEFQPMHMIGGR